MTDSFPNLDLSCLDGLERRLWEIGELEECMSDIGCDPESIVRTNAMFDRWELAELDRINATRPPSRCCRRLPVSAYEALRLMGYAE